MSRSRVFGTRLLAIVFLSLVTAGANAAFNRELIYTGTLEEHSREDNEAFSELTLNLDDDQAWSRYSNDYDLSLSYFYDHVDGEKNDQYEGYYNGLILVTESSSIVWNINGTAQVIAPETGQEIEEFESDNLTVLSTGPTFRLFRDLRGVTELSLLTARVNYQDTDLDSSVDQANLRHSYPLRSNEQVIAEFYHSSTEYDDEINESNNYDSDRFSLAYESATRVQNVRLWGAVTEIDHVSDPDTQNEIEFDYLYRINSRSTVGLSIGDSLENAAEFNTRNIVDRNVLLVSSLIRSKRFEVNYGYFHNQEFYEARLFSEEVDLVFEDDEPQEITGATLTYIRTVGREWRYFLEFEITQNDFVDDRFRSLTGAITYRKEHTRYTVSEFAASVESDAVDSDVTNDYILSYRLEHAIFR